MYRIEQEELSNRVYKAIKQMILDNELVSGEKLNQEKLAKKFGISRTPVLSAFSKLQQEMLVEQIPRRGTYVKKLNKKEFQDLYDIRMRLEPLGAAEAAKLHNNVEMRRLEEILDDFETLVSEGHSKGLREKDYEFHMMVMEMSRNELLKKIISAFNLNILSNLEGLLKEPSQSLDEHKELVKAIKARNEADAENAMYRHIYGSRQNIDSKHFS